MGELDRASHRRPRGSPGHLHRRSLEAPNSRGEEYGEARLTEVIQANRGLPVNELLAVIQASVEEFSGLTQADDITLIVARCR